MRNFFQMAIIIGSLMMINACKNKPAGDAAAVGAEATAAAQAGQTLSVDVANSKIMWEGSKPAGKHNGTIDVKSGTVSVENGQITGGSFVIDMNSIIVSDLEGDQKAGLEGHLKGSDPKNEDDFFNVAKYPEAKFDITKVTVLSNDPEATHLVYGNLTMKDVTKEVGFKAKVDASNGVTVTTPQFTINRTDWGIKYGSKSFFDNLKDKFIEDNMGIQIILSAK